MKITDFSAQFVIDGFLEIQFNDIPLENGKYVSEGFALEITQSEDNCVNIKLSALNNDEFELSNVTYFIGIPLCNPGMILVPDTGRHFMNTIYPRQVMMQAEFLVSSAHMSTPFLAFMSNTGRVLQSFGLLGDIVDTSFKLLSPGANKKFSLVVKDEEWKWQITKPYDKSLSLGRMRVFEDGFFQGSGELNWFYSLQGYAKVYQDRHDISVQANENVYKPQFCTWRVINSDYMNHEWVVKMARECKAIGLEVMILDDGWFGVGLDSDIMESSLGDWPKKVEGKFDDICETISAIKREGVHPVLWFCPLGLGPQSGIFDKYKKYCVSVEGRPYQTPGLFRTLCPRNPQARTVMVQMLRKVLSYNPDGFKPDLFNYQPAQACDANHEHDIPNTLEALRECMRLMYEEAIQWKEDAIFMLKNDEANVDFCQFGPSIRSGDSPYDPNIMFLRCAYPNAFGKAVINDYLMIGRSELPKEIAYSMIKQVTMGTPAVSIDLLKMTKEQKEVLRVWLGLYNEELKRIHIGASVEPQDSGMNCWIRMDGSASRAIITVVSPSSVVEFLPNVREIYLLNASDCEGLFVRRSELTGDMDVQCFDYMHRKVYDYMYRGQNRIEVPSGGYAKFVKSG